VIDVAHDRDHGRPGYEVLTIGLTNRPFVAESGIEVRPQKTFANAPALDTLIIPGGRGLRQAATGGPVSKFIKARAASTRRIVCICTGIYGLAPTGLLHGRRVAAHWRFVKDIASQFPDLRVDDNAIFLQDGPFYTCAGAAAGVDLAISLIESDYGIRVALAVARELVVYLKRSGGEGQYSEPLRFQTESIDRFAELAGWIASHLHGDLTTESLAARVFLCSRQFTRRFKTAFGKSPATFVEELRLSEARRLLAMGTSSLEQVSASVGFKSADAFRRAFERRLGINPSDYRRRFNREPPISSRRSRRNSARNGAK
jgi:transcriptional regulator GlxA family with amidase domain